VVAVGCEIGVPTAGFVVEGCLDFEAVDVVGDNATVGAGVARSLESGLCKVPAEAATTGEIITRV